MKYCPHCKSINEVLWCDKFDDLFFSTCEECGNAAIMITNILEVDIGGADWNFSPSELLEDCKEFEDIKKTLDLSPLLKFVFFAAEKKVAVFEEETFNQGFFWLGNIIEDQSVSAGYKITPEKKIYMKELNYDDEHKIWTVEQLWKASEEVGGFTRIDIDKEGKIVFSGHDKPKKTPYTTGAVGDEIEFIGVHMKIEAISPPLYFKIDSINAVTNS